MANNYIRPGVYIQELFKPRAAVPPTLGFNLVLVGKGSKKKKILNEQVIRGKIYGESLTVSGTPPHTATLANTSNQKKDDTTVYKDGQPLPLNAFSFVNATTIEINPNYYDSGSTYTIDYVSLDNYVDALDNTISEIKSVGLFPGSKNYEEFTDFNVSGNLIDWSGLIEASFTGLNSEPFDISVNNKIKLSLDGKPSLEITLTAADPNNATAAEIATSINSALVADANYGSAYASVASDAGGQVKLESPGIGELVGFNSVINILDSGVNSAVNIVFGLQDGQNYEYRGTGKRPSPGKTYYVTYFITRPDSDYNTVKRFLNDSDFYNDIGYPEVGNELAIAGELAWSQGIVDLYVVQVKDSDNDGIYTDNDYVNALDAIIDRRELTDIVVLRSSAIIRARVKEIVETESSLLKSNYKRYWCGAPRDTQIGDASTPDSYIYISKVEFSVVPDSPARGRFILVAPSNLTRITNNEDGNELILSVDSNIAATMLAARTISFETASTSLFGKTFSGLTIDSEYTNTEKTLLASNGVFVLETAGGSIRAFDSLTTDASGDARYEEPSASTQKDNLAFKIMDAIDSQLKGIVPDDVGEFVLSIKTVVGGVILAEIDNGNVGYYLDEEGNVRDIDYTTDIVAFREATDPRNYKFRYYFNLRYPAKRFFGEFTVDFPLTS